MAQKRGGENIWIAYADMLTVLLMVFLLLAMLFQVIVATSKIAGPEDQAGNQKSQAEQSAKQAASKFGETVEKQQNKPSSDGNINDGMEQVATKLPLVMVDTAALQPRDGDLRINVELNRTYLTGVQQNEVRAWALRNKSVLATEKLRIYSVGRSINVSTGDTLLLQVNRAVATMAALQKEGAIIKNIRFDNLIVPNNTDDFIILRVENTDANNGKTQ
ncbi:hypothetical protein BBC0178_018290 [Bartonella apihabitans]|uniref:Uncharacterized protein n=1 Tax=Bartonella apihabitans TaxID=2750929 RepID=A0A1U9MCT6_9HYPH|nr:hypothetical protein [Bartonella apihabitans]AQT43279.1 hypothetical protein BBC0178_018290 [Bartonella apihabitans]